jgi:hypothetical protein
MPCAIHGWLQDGDEPKCNQEGEAMTGKAPSTPRRSLHSELENESRVTATEMVRLWELRSFIQFCEDRIQQVISKSTPRPRMSGTTDNGRLQHRTKNIRSSNGYGHGCTTCDGNIDTPTFMTLTIGNYAGKLMLDLCYQCAVRLLNVVEARFEDKRRRIANET